MSFISSRSMHRMATLPFKSTDGALPFLSTKGLSNILQMQKTCLQKVDELSNGTEMDQKSLKMIVELSVAKPAHVPLYNYASHAWNNDFFLQALSSTKLPMSLDLQNQIEKEFGGMSSLQKEFSMHAENIFGSGWTWLVLSAESKLKIVNTYNSNSPFFTRDNSTLMTTKAVATGNKPLLALNMWEHAFVLDYGMDKAKYVESFWNNINWVHVEALLMSAKK